ncbi:hypothetical protein LTR78_003624 [Recurvomyces mirabilis]|uniref:Methylated-DNA--protein-cysteine methyltransferase n=1 Tax=Recurvomyces mirabilis TaxID=574656 RepID=A0AAE1C385_9PEZI|nr:hypothetical protein LTR78_003624 [Recurvomyces mirabilis]KAK5154738.1 hypothetical protein LTS14_006317 [Recurvomyces mirabilis]
MNKSDSANDGAMDDLRQRWNHLYKHHLPGLAKTRDPVQGQWPVYLDHCFARIVLDNAIGIDKPWMEVIRQPAVKNMTEDQLRDAVDLAEKIATGELDLVSLDERSLQLRGKQKKKRKVEAKTEGNGTSKKKLRGDPTISTYFAPPPDSPFQGEDTKADTPANVVELGDESRKAAQEANPDMAAQVKRIADSNITTFRKQTLTLLCQVPRGRYSTYQAMSDHITKTSHKTCARAVGNAMRNNPFAPEVPCHRILAADGSLGGFNGSWGENGKFAGEKHKLLHEEGVRFSSSGKVKGPPFRDFT